MSKGEKEEDMPEFEVHSFIWKKGAFKGDLTLHCGRSNHCTVKGDTVFHLYIDCDDIPISNLFAGIESLRNKFPELEKIRFIILETSPAHYSTAAFTHLSWERYLEILWYAVEIGIEHEGHAFYTTGKGYGVLRTGGKDGIVPHILFMVGEETGCDVCMREFVDSFDS